MTIVSIVTIYVHVHSKSVVAASYVCNIAPENIYEDGEGLELILLFSCLDIVIRKCSVSLVYTVA